MKTTPRLPVLKTYKVYIGGKFPRSESGRYTVFARPGVKVNVCRCSRKDLRNAVVAARAAFPGWAKAAAYLRGQILYRAAEMLEGRAAQFAAELEQEGASPRAAAAEVTAAVDELVYYAGWADKVQQVFSTVNPVADSYFSFSQLEPQGVVGVVAPAAGALRGLVATLAPAIAGGNTAVVLAAEAGPLSAATFAEVLHVSDLPGGVANILTGLRRELLSHLAGHFDVNAIVCPDASLEERKLIDTQAALNVKRVAAWKPGRPDPYRILDLQEVKTTWHPIGA
jgi:acyl-CoA reductase-like NAD-dependent aldehyde dehydrogenase